MRRLALTLGVASFSGVLIFGSAGRRSAATESSMPTGAAVVGILARDDGYGNGKVFLLSPSDGRVRLGPTLPADGTLFSASVSRDRRRIALILGTANGSARLDVVDLRDGRSRTIGTSAPRSGGHTLGSVAWGPGDEIAVADDAGTNITIMRASGRVLRKIAPTTEGARFEGAGVDDWSRDGRKLVLTGIGTQEGIRPYTLDLRGGGAAKLIGQDDIVSNARWSPNGRAIAYEQTTQQSDDPINTLNVISTSGANDRVIVEPARHRGLAWSPDGSQITFVQKTDTNTGEVMICRADGSHTRQVPTLSVPSGWLILSVLAWI